MITFLEECELKVFPYPYHKKKENKGSEMFTDSIQIIKLLSSWNRYCTLVWLHQIPDSFHFALLSLQPPFPGVHPHLICTFQRAEQATYIFLFQSSNFLLDLTQRSIPFQRHPLSLIEIIFRKRFGISDYILTMYTLHSLQRNDPPQFNT